MGKRHGMSKTKMYGRWSGIKSRCYNKNTKAYKNYGGRGVYMQDCFIDDYMCFYEYVTSLESYDEKSVRDNIITIDRINNEKGYIKGNLRWANWDLQAKNRRHEIKNKSGFVGVTLSRSNKFIATIAVKRKTIHLGTRDTIKEAYKLRQDYIKKHNLKGYK